MRPAVTLVLLLSFAGGCVGPLDRRPGLDLPPGGWTEGTRSSLLVLGDTGRVPPVSRWFHRQRAVGRGLVEEDRRSPIDALLFLGDNFYWDGLERRELAYRIATNVARPYCRFVRDGPRAAEIGRACRLPESERHPVPIYAVLGDHDYHHEESPDLQRHAVPEFVGNWHVPEGMVEVAELPGGVSLVLLDSVAFRAGADPAPLERGLRASRGPWRILASHHPLAHARDRSHERDEAREAAYRTRVYDAIARSGVPVHLIASGEEHNLQLIGTERARPALQLVSGSGSRVRELRTTNPQTRFALARPGFARIDLVGRGDREWLEVALFVTGSVHWVGPRRPRLVAHVRIDPDGTIRDLLAAARPRKTR